MFVYVSSTSSKFIRMQFKEVMYLVMLVFRIVHILQSNSLFKHFYVNYIKIKMTAKPMGNVMEHSLLY